MGWQPLALKTSSTRATISSATLTLHYWNELASPSAVLLNTGTGTADSTIQLSQAGTAAEGDLIQIDSEVLQVAHVLEDGLRYDSNKSSPGKRGPGPRPPRRLFIT